MKKYGTFTSIGIGILLFIIFHLVTFVFAQIHFIQNSPFEKQVTLKAIMAIVSVILGIYFFKVPKSDFSLLQNKKQVKHTKYVLMAGLFGAISSAIILLGQFPALPLLKSLSFLQIVVAVWVVSTICEEFFARGLIQSIVKDDGGKYGIFGFQISKPVFVGAAVFGLTHLSIYYFGGSPYTTIVIVIFTFLLGLVAGMLKEANGLRFAIWAHLAFNIGGVAIAILLKVFRVI
jgi:membrane protease YdiL (CAAX protease family)